MKQQKATSKPQIRVSLPTTVLEEIDDSNPLLHLKKSFAPFASPNMEILILGTLPGDRSLALNEYYGHAQNKFWRVISAVTRNELPSNYPDKKNLLKKMKIGIWDVTHNAIRKGSLDSAIKSEQPNDLENFITKHKKLRVIGFNGQKAEALYNKYFKKIEGIRYITLPSTSPANAGISFDNICLSWKQILVK
jgi:hypoxanthine-DNA glycosylase